MNVYQVLLESGPLSWDTCIRYDEKNLSKKHTSPTLLGALCKDPGWVVVLEFVEDLVFPAKSWREMMEMLKDRITGRHLSSYFFEV